MNNKDELYHWGVPGMRWGHRKAVDKTSSRAKKEKWNEDAIEAARIKKKKVSQMSNKELKALNERQNLEENHRRLNPNAIKKGLAIAGAIAGAMGTIAALYSGGTKLMNIGKKTAQAYDNSKSKAFWKGMSNLNNSKTIDFGKTTYEQFLK